MIFKKQAKILPEEKTAQEFVNVEDIAEGMLFSNDGWIFGYLYVRSRSDKLLSPQERENHWRGVAAALETEKQPWQLISVPRTVDISGMITHLNTLKRQTHEDARLKLIDGEIAAMQKMLRLGTKEPMIILKIWEKAEKKADVLLKKRLNRLKDELDRLKVNTEILTDEDIVFICKIFADLAEYQSLDDIQSSEEALPIIKGGKRSVSLEAERAALLHNLITPIGGIRFYNDKVILGSSLCRAYGAVRYASELSPSWAMELMNNTDCFTAITYNPANRNELAAALSEAIKKNQVDAENTRDFRKRKSIERETRDGESLMEDLDERGEAIGFMHLITVPYSSDEEEFEEICRTTVNLCARQKIHLRRLGFMQKEALQSALPYYVPPDIIGHMLGQIMPLRTLAGGSPMTVNLYRDDGGSYFAKTKDGTVMTLNLNYRGKDRTNSNIVVLGAAGTGKSTALKHIMQTAYMEGWKILVIDPEREFAELCRKLNGNWLDTGGGKNQINPLEIRPVPDDEEDEDEKDRLYTEQEKSSALALHMKTLKIFFSLYIPELTKLQEVLLEQALLELYKKFGIVWDTDVSSFTPEQFPIFTDLYRELEARKETDGRYRDLSDLIYSAAYGADSFLWNGHTNLQTDSRFVCFDTNKLNDSGDDIKRTQYFNILTLAWQIMSEDRSQPVLLICDEAYLMIDPNIPQSLMFLRNVEKRCRKYSGALAVVSHSIVDFLAPAIKMYGQAILDIPTYKLFFGADGQNLKELTDLYSLTEEEQNILSAKMQREALCMLGSSRVHVVFDIPQYKLDLMGRGGGR